MSEREARLAYIPELPGETNYYCLRNPVFTNKHQSTTYPLSPHDFAMTFEMKTSFPPGPTSTLSNQDSSSPPAALTVVLSVACGAVATCILVTVRHPKKNEHTNL